MDHRRGNFNCLTSCPEVGENPCTAQQKYGLFGFPVNTAPGEICLIAKKGQGEPSRGLGAKRSYQRHSSHDWLWQHLVHCPTLPHKSSRGLVLAFNSCDSPWWHGGTLAPWWGRGRRLEDSLVKVDDVYHVRNAWCHTRPDRGKATRTTLCAVQKNIRRQQQYKSLDHVQAAYLQL